MASKSKKRRRVLGASCILAALIIAGSSFAWFTSSDEVTNRLTASSDYGVSIVETFTPPKKWVPGQTIKKEVYAVNTGNIDAFVEEEISGLLTYTYEVVVDKFGVTGVDYEELNNDSLKAAQSKEAGGYLIWNNAGVENGPFGTDFVATKSGDYIFRRAIDTATNTGGNSVKDEKYTLEGYHYDETAGKYYKIQIEGNDDDPNFYEVGDKKYVAMNAEGTALAADPVIKYYTIHEATAKPVSLKYEGTGDDNYLAATYKTAAPVVSGTTTYAGTAATAQDIVDKANTVALYEGKKALADLGDAQRTAMNAVKEKADDVVTKAGLYKAAYEAAVGADGNGGSAAAAKTSGTTLYNATDTGTTPISTYLVSAPDTVSNADTADKVYVITETDVDNSTLSDVAKNKVKAAITNYSTASAALDTAKTNLKNAIDALHIDDIKNGVATKATVQGLHETFDTCATAYYDAAVNLQNAYADLNAQTVDSGLDDGNNTNSTTTLSNLVNTATQWKSGEHLYRDTLDTNITDYETKAGTNETNTTSMNTAFDNYVTACTNYSNTLSSAASDYSTETGKFDTAKTSSKSTDELSATGFDTLVGGQKMGDAGLITDTTLKAAAYSAATSTAITSYSGTEVAEGTNVPSVTGNDSTTGSVVADTNYQGTVQVLRGYINDTSNVSAYDTAKGYLDSLTNGVDDASVLNADNAAHEIKIKINLADGVKGDQTWSQIPTTDGAEVAHFYLNKVLAAGETSDMLIKSVELDGESTTPASFKDMTFDLNVALKSAQVTYDDQNNILPTAADTTFTNAEVASVDQTTKAVTWQAKA